MYQKKLRLERFHRYAHQRSGWAFALQSLTPLLDEACPVMLDSIVERNFGKGYAVALAEGRIPYRSPWIGVVHVPPDSPKWWEPWKNPSSICQLPHWQESLPHCRGLIALSRSLGDWLRSTYPNLPVLDLYHPTEDPPLKFDFEAYLRGGQRVVQVGWWLRRLTSIHWLPIPRKRKSLLLPFADADLVRFLRLVEVELARDSAPPLQQWHATIQPHLSDRDYDALLSRSVVFLHLYAASATNAILESIVRHTPVLVNPLPAVREYLGGDYPLYFESLDEAAAKASDVAKVREAHQYLAAKDKHYLSGEEFCRSFAESTLYRLL